MFWPGILLPQPLKVFDLMFLKMKIVFLSFSRTCKIIHLCNNAFVLRISVKMGKGQLVCHMHGLMAVVTWHFSVCSHENLLIFYSCAVELRCFVRSDLQWNICNHVFYLILFLLCPFLLQRWEYWRVFLQRGVSHRKAS